ncbi:MAG: T9SS type A sorting domain-containing protein [Bacteroidota bacterium]
MYLKYIFGVVTLCLLVFTLSAQPCDRSISTDPDNPVNPQCPELINTFDWRTEMLPVTESTPGLPSSPPNLEIRSPFWEDESTGLNFLTDPFFSTFHDFEVADGWEMLYIDMEYRPNKEYVYFMLYNKYESFIRVFANQQELSSTNNSASVQVEFSSGDASALLSPFSGQSQSLDMESVGTIEVGNEYYNNSFRFTYFDIPVEYDPCTCQSENSSLAFEFGLIDQREINMYTRYADVEQLLATQFGTDGDTRIAPDEFLAGLNDGTVGVETYKTWEQLQSYYSDLSSEVDELKKQYNRIQAFDKVFSLALKAGGGDVLKTLKLIKILETGPDGEPVKFTGKEAAEVFLGGLNLFGAGVKKKLDAATQELKALGSSTLTLGEQVSRGSNDGEYQLGGPTFSLPGTATDCTDPDNYPLYNEALGRMALLRKPQVSVQPFGAEISDVIGTAVVATQLSLDPSSIQYVFNPAAHIDEDATEINAMLRVYDLDNEATSSPNMTRINDEPIGFVSPLLPLGCFGDYVSQINFFTEVPPVPILPLNLKVDLVLFVAYTFDDGNQAFQQYTYPVELTEESVILTDILSAPSLLPASTPAFFPDLQLEATDYTEDEFIFAYSQIDIVGDQRLANFNETTTLVVIDGVPTPVTTVTPGEPIFVEIVAPQVLVKRGADLIAGPPTGSGGEIWLHSEEYFQDCDPLPPSDEDLVAFCDSDDYRANIIQAVQGLEGITPTAPPTPLEQFQGEPMALTISPNPVGNYASITLDLPHDEVVTISIIDITGKTVATLVQGQSLLTGRHYFDLPGHSLLPGNYILRAQTQTETVVSRFVR